MKLHHSDVHKKIHCSIVSNLPLVFKENSALRILLAVSGGMDSVLMTHHCVDLSKRFGWSFVIAHVNHMQRGKDSDEDEMFCEDLAKKLNFDFVSERIRDLGTDASEDALREKRYLALRRMRKQKSCDYVFLAHHASDQAETVLMKMLCGANLKGLSAMKLRASRWIRPMLHVSKKDIEYEMAQSDFVFRNDLSNQLNAPRRNFLRNKVFPLLKSSINPRTVEHLCDLATSFSELHEYMQKKARRQIQKSRIDEMVFSVDILAKSPPVLLKHTLALMFEEFSNGHSMTRKHIYMLANAIYKGDGNKTIQLPMNKSARIHQKKLIWLNDRGECIRVEK